jgi:hypothetical protein
MLSKFILYAKFRNQPTKGLTRGGDLRKAVNVLPNKANLNCHLYCTSISILWGIQSMKNILVKDFYSSHICFENCFKMYV